MTICCMAQKFSATCYTEPQFKRHRNDLIFPLHFLRTDDIQIFGTFSYSLLKQCCCCCCCSLLPSCNSGDRCIFLPSTLSSHLFEASLHRSICYMPQMLMSDIMPALTLSAGCKCYHRSLHRHNAPIYIQLARGGNITAHERKMPCHLLNYTSPAAQTLKKKFLIYLVATQCEWSRISQRLLLLYFIREASSMYNMTTY